MIRLVRAHLLKGSRTNDPESTYMRDIDAAIIILVDTGGVYPFVRMSYVSWKHQIKREDSSVAKIWMKMRLTAR